MGEQQIADIIYQIISINSSNIQEAVKEWKFEVVPEVSSNDNKSGFYHVLSHGIRPNFIEAFLMTRHNMTIGFEYHPRCKDVRTTYLNVSLRRPAQNL